MATKSAQTPGRSLRRLEVYSDVVFGRLFFARLDYSPRSEGVEWTAYRRGLVLPLAIAPVLRWQQAKLRRSA